MLNKGPIPGENFTSDTKNYPWHQPPEFTDLNKALDMMGDKLTKFKVATGIMATAELGIPLYKITTMILVQGIGEGKWTPDFALLLAGPVTRMIELICQGFDVEYELGLDDDEDDFVTGTFFKEKKSLEQRSVDGFEVLENDINEIKQQAEGQEAPDEESEGDIQSEGFMAMNKAPEQEV